MPPKKKGSWSEISGLIYLVQRKDCKLMKRCQTWPITSLAKASVKSPTIWGAALETYRLYWSILTLGGTAVCKRLCLQPQVFNLNPNSFWSTRASLTDAGQQYGGSCYRVGGTLWGLPFYIEPVLLPSITDSGSWQQQCQSRVTRYDLRKRAPALQAGNFTRTIPTG